MTTSPFPAASNSFTGVRPINISRDMPHVMRLLNQVFSPTLDAEGRRALNSMGNVSPMMMRLNRLGLRVEPGFVWEDNRKIIGNISIIPSKSRGRYIVANVAVHPDYRRRGIAFQLMEQAIAHLEASNCHSIALQVDANNDGAIRLYDQMEFAALGTTTLWSAPAGQWKEISAGAGVSSEIRPIRRHEATAAYQLDLSCQRNDLNWPDPITEQHYQQSLLRAFDDFFNGKQVETWTIAHEGKLLGLASIYSEWGRSHRLTLRVPETYQYQLTRPLLAKLLRRLRYLKRRNLTLEHSTNDGEMNHLLRAANFHPRRHLTTMLLKL